MGTRFSPQQFVFKQAPAKLTSMCSSQLWMNYVASGYRKCLLTSCSLKRGNVFSLAFFILNFKSGSYKCRITTVSNSGFKQNTFMATDLDPWPRTSRWDDSCALGSLWLLVYSCNKGPCSQPNGLTYLVVLTEASGPPSTGLSQAHCIWWSLIVLAHLPKGWLSLMVLLDCMLPGFMVFAYFT